MRRASSYTIYIQRGSRFRCLCLDEPAEVARSEKNGYSDLAVAIAAAVAGDVIEIGEGTFTCNNKILPNGADLVGTSKSGSGGA